MPKSIAGLLKDAHTCLSMVLDEIEIMEQKSAYVLVILGIVGAASKSVELAEDYAARAGAE